MGMFTSRTYLRRSSRRIAMSKVSHTANYELYLISVALSSKTIWQSTMTYHRFTDFAKTILGRL